MYLLHAELKAHVHTTQEVRRRLESLVQTTANEPGNVIFAAHSSVGNPLDFVVQELYRGREDCDLHLASEPVQAFMASFDTLLQTPPRIVFGELIGGSFKQLD